MIIKRFSLIGLILSVFWISGCAGGSSSQQGNSQDVKRQGNADVVYVKAVENANHSWTLHVTVRHPDKGWDDYANGWDVVTPDGTVLKPDSTDKFTRTLLHPHVDEQPFTRSQSGIVIPPDVVKVKVIAHDIVDGYGGEEIVVDLTTDKGNGYEVERIP